MAVWGKKNKDKEGVSEWAKSKAPLAYSISVSHWGMFPCTFYEHSEHWQRGGLTHSYDMRGDDGTIYGLRLGDREL